jgi:hypothetical protein
MLPGARRHPNTRRHPEAPWFWAEGSLLFLVLPVLFVGWDVTEKRATANSKAKRKCEGNGNGEGKTGERSFRGWGLARQDDDSSRIASVTAVEAKARATAKAKMPRFP